MGHEALSPQLQLRCMFLRSGKVFEFVGVVFQMEELLVTVERVIEILPSPVGESVPMDLGAVADVVFEVDVLAPAFAPGANKLQQALSFDAFGDGSACGVEKSGQDVPEFYGVGNDLPCGAQAHAGGRPHDHGDVCGLLVAISLPPEILVAQHVAVVGDEEDQRLVEKLALFEYFENAAYLLIHEADGAVVAPARAANFVCGQFSMPELVARSAALFESAGPIGDLRFGQWSVFV